MYIDSENYRIVIIVVLQKYVWESRTSKNFESAKLYKVEPKSGIGYC